MQRLAACLGLLAVAGGVAVAGEVSPAYRMKAECAESGVVISPGVYDGKWKSHEPIGLPKDGAGERSPFRITFGSDADGKKSVSGGIVFSETNGCVRVEYDFSAEESVPLKILFVKMNLGMAEGETFECDKRQIALDTLVDRNGEVLNAWARRFSVAKGGQSRRFSVELDRPLPFTLLHHETGFTLRFNLAYGELESNRTVRCALVIADGADASPTRLGKIGVRVGEDEGWVRVEPFRDVVPGTALDFSALRGDCAPAGKHGRIVRRGGHFEFEGLPGVSQRFYGVNICDSANVPDYETAKTFARRLARIGYNSVRIHHHEKLLVIKDDMTTLNEEAMRRFDGFVAACIEEGLYLTTDLFVSRGPIPRRACGMMRMGRSLSGR